MHFGVRGHFIATDRGVCSIESYDGEQVLTPEFLEKHCLKYRPTDVSLVQVEKSLNRMNLTF